MNKMKHLKMFESFGPGLSNFKVDVQTTKENPDLKETVLAVGYSDSEQKAYLMAIASTVLCLETGGEETEVEGYEEATKLILNSDYYSGSGDLENEDLSDLFSGHADRAKSEVVSSGPTKGYMGDKGAIRSYEFVDLTF